jgi:uncharacterized membrane protein YidH (DUF202 family)
VNPVDPHGELVDGGLQQERTALAWERTAISVVVVGIIVVRLSALESWWPLVVAGLAQTAAGAAALVWAGAHHEELHGRLARGEEVVHPSAARLLGVLTIAGTGSALILAAMLALHR